MHFNYANYHIQFACKYAGWVNLMVRQWLKTHHWCERVLSLSIAPILCFSNYWSLSLCPDPEIIARRRLVFSWQVVRRAPIWAQSCLPLCYRSSDILLFLRTDHQFSAAIGFGVSRWYLLWTIFLRYVTLLIPLFMPSRSLSSWKSSKIFYWSCQRHTTNSNTESPPASNVLDQLSHTALSYSLFYLLYPLRCLVAG